MSEGFRFRLFKSKEQMKAPEINRSQVYEELTSQLDSIAEEALQDTREERNHLLAKRLPSIALNSLKTGHGSEASIDTDQLENVWQRCVEETVSAFDSVVKEDGTIAQGAEIKDLYTKAYNTPRFINAKHLLEVARCANPEMSEAELVDLISKTDYFSVRNMVANMLGLSEDRKNNLRKDKESILSFLGKFVDSDYAKDALETMPFREGTASINTQELSVLELAFRTANLTWMTGQVNRRIYEESTEGKKKRANSETQSNFRAFDQMVAIMNEQGGVDRVAFEIMKDFGELREIIRHEKARTEKAEGYPNRFPVDDEHVMWNNEFKEYAPAYYVAPSVIENDSTKKEGGWAHPEDFSLVQKADVGSYEPLKFDEEGLPLNPRGRTGLKGRGLLGRWGANFAADPVITCNEPKTGELMVLVIQRDNGEWALPGGMQDKGEKLSRTVARELNEEAGLDLDMNQASLVYEGYVDDPRNTDNAWMETSAYHLHLNKEQTLQALQNIRAGSDAKAVRFMSVQEVLSKGIYASHKDILARAVK